MTVSKPTTVDWTFVLSNQSLSVVPDGWLPPDYDSTKQRYEVVLPKHYSDKTEWPVLLFVSPSPQPAALRQWAAYCQSKGVLLASPYDAGNGVAMPQRVRLVCDVLSDLRDKYKMVLRET